MLRQYLNGSLLYNFFVWCTVIQGAFAGIPLQPITVPSLPSSEEIEHSRRRLPPTPPWPVAPTPSVPPLLMPPHPSVVNESGNAVKQLLGAFPLLWKAQVGVGHPGTRPEYDIPYKPLVTAKCAEEQYMLRGSPKVEPENLPVAGQSALPLMLDLARTPKHVAHSVGSPRPVFGGSPSARYPGGSVLVDIDRATTTSGSMPMV